ncbi:PREDICTED: uncharacterized protein LOC18601175 [Theobroma cacao]|uniref:Uncharacterized protein LOC18601175 n=1 Tax=Theobroma cacao TaxID=3641 RepID=A0AB32V682_THECC|nr:PREDICTED: uncharacterized protein LOC18601175 [Theobroma cacao]
MKNKASGLLKQIITYLTTMAKAKTLAFKSKTKAIKTRLVIFSLLRNKKLLMSSISQKLNGLMGQNDRNSKELEDGVAGGLEDQQSQAIMLCNSNSAMWLPSATRTETEMEMELQEKGEYEEGEDDEEVEDKYPDLTHSLFDSEEMEFEDPGGSVIDIVKNSKEDKGEEFKLEDEIDRVADLFIRRFHRQIRLQKQLSLKRRQEMLERSI